MSRIIWALIMGIILALVPFFFFFVGIKIHYLDFYEIKEYFNILFVDYLPWPFFWLAVLLLGALFVLPRKHTASGTVLLLLFIGSLTSLHPKVGHELGMKLLSTPHFHIKEGRFIYSGILLYQGRTKLYMYSQEHNKTLTFTKEKIDEAY